LRRAGWSRSLSVWQNTPHSGTLKRALRSSAWLWCFMFGFRFHSSMCMTFCMSGVLCFVKVKSHIFGARKEVSVDFSYSIHAILHKLRLQKLLLNQTMSIYQETDQRLSSRRWG